MTELQNIDWSLLKKQLPYKTTPDAKARRDELWKSIDVNGNGYVSLAEVDKGLRDNLQCYQVFDCKPVIIRAFNAAKGSVKNAKTHGADYVDRSEFRLLLAYLRQYFEYYQAFCRVDETDDHRINRAEFVKAAPKIEKWVGPIADPDATFDQIDSNGGGVILFDEFVAWAIKKNLDLEDDDE